MNNTTTRPYKLTRIVLGIVAAALCALPARAQYVSTILTNLNHPAGVAVDSSYNAYITDPGNHRVAKFIPSSGNLSTLASGFAQPQGIVAAWGGLVVADENSSLIDYVTFGGSVTTLAGQAYKYGTGDGQGTNAQFSFPVGIAADSAGNLYVADSQAGSVRKIDLNTNVTTLATGFNLPVAVAVDGFSNVWVADAADDVIYMISNGASLYSNASYTVAAGAIGEEGTNDAETATSARFNAPSGLLWLGNGSGLYISDTGNHTIRSLTFDGVSAYDVQTVAGVPGQPGLVNGALSVAKFGTPTGLCVDPTDLGFYVADSANNALRVLQSTAPLPAVNTPILGYVTFPPSANPPNSSVFVASTSAVFNNTVDIAIEASAGTLTYITYGPTGTAIPQPGPGSTSPPLYPGDGTSAMDISSIISPGPGTNDITIYAVGVQSGRQSSPVVSARYQFVAANPTITGNNAADILLTDLTAGANLYYTINGTSPTNDGSSMGPVGSGTILSLDIASNVTLEVRAFESGFATSQIVSNQLLVSNVVGNQLTWGFESGLASTHYITGLNMSFSSPITFTPLATSLAVYTMQFDAGVTNNGTNNGANAPPGLGADNFIVHLLQPDPAPPEFKALPPGIFDAITDTTNVGISATQPATLELAWLVTPPVTNLYTSPSLLYYSGVDETLFVLGSQAGAVVGELQFVIPPSTVPGNPLTLQLSYASASSYNDPYCCGLPIGVFVQTPTNGSLTSGSINAIKLITVLSNNSPASAHLVGDVFPFTWYNIGDFGDGLLQNDDVIMTMEYAFGNPYPYPVNNPYYNAMDSSDGSINTFYSASDSAIDSITNGDGIIAVDDVYVTLRRSLDPSLVNYSRYWSGSNWVPTVYPNSVQVLGAPSTATPAASPALQAQSATRNITVAADQVQTSGGLTAQVPIRVLAADPLPLRVFMLNVQIEPLDGSPAINSSVTFNAVTNVGSPYATVSRTPNTYGAAWLDSTVLGVSGTNLIGTLTVTLPSNVNSKSAYRVHFNHFSASPNGLALFHPAIQDGLITVGNRSASSWHDGIPDSWRLLYFGTVSNALSAANADPDGDGANNWEEYIAGTNPLDGTSVFKFSPSAAPSGSAFTLQWPSVVNKLYTVQCATTPGGVWTTIASNLAGNGQTLSWTDTNASGNTRFYRALVQ